MAQRELTKIDVGSMAKVFGGIYAIVGLVMGLLFAALGSGTPIISGIGLASVLVLPVVYGLIGLISGIVMAVVYNFVVKYTKGIKVEVK